MAQHVSKIRFFDASAVIADVNSVNLAGQAGTQASDEVMRFLEAVTNLRMRTTFSNTS
jgi:hypothetical protein